MKQTQKSWVGKSRAVSREMVKTLIGQVKKRYKQLKNRYGPRYTKSMVAAPLFTLFVPIPGISLLAVALVVAVAEVHRAISMREGRRQTSAKEIHRQPAAAGTGQGSRGYLGRGQKLEADRPNARIPF